MEILPGILKEIPGNIVEISWEIPSYMGNSHVSIISQFYWEFPGISHVPSKFLKTFLSQEFAISFSNMKICKLPYFLEKDPYYT